MTALHKTKDGCFFSSQGDAKGAKQGSCKTAVIRDNAEEAGIGKDTITQGGAWWQGSKAEQGYCHPDSILIRAVLNGQQRQEGLWVTSTVNTTSMDRSFLRKRCSETTREVSKGQSWPMSSLHCWASHLDTQLQSPTQEGDNA